MLDTVIVSQNFTISWAVEELFAEFSDKTKLSGSARGPRELSFNQAATGADLVTELLASVFTIPAGTFITIDLADFVNALGVVNSSFSALRSVYIRHVADAEAQVSATGTASSQITVGDSGVDAHTLFMKDITDAIALGNGEEIAFAWRNEDGCPVDSVTSGQGHDLKIENDDALVDAVVLVVISGIAP